MGQHCINGAHAAFALHASVLQRRVPKAVRIRAAGVKARLKRVVRAAGTTPELKILAAPQFTVLAPKRNGLQPAAGGFVFLTAIDAPTATGTPASNTSFDLLCAGFFLGDRRAGEFGGRYGGSRCGFG